MRRSLWAALVRRVLVGVSFDVTLGSDATLVGWQFVVDGLRYLLPTAQPGEWVQDFFGAYSSYNWNTGLDDNGGGLAGNMGPGYAVPGAGGTLTLLGCALVGLGALRRKFRV